MPNRLANILLIEDDIVDAKAVKKALQKAEIHNPLYVAKNGIEGLEYLRGSEEQPSIDSPFIIVLDLNMPLMDGHEFLEVLRDDPDLKKSIVFVLTTSNNCEDKLNAYEKNIAAYILKKDVGDDFKNLTDLIKNYFSTVQLPYC